APMVTHRFHIENAAKAYELMRGERKKNYLGIILEYNLHSLARPKRVETRPLAAITTHKIKVGVIGAGKYATAHLLPYLRQHPSITLGTICTASGLTAVRVAERFGFQAVDADTDAVIEESDALLIATRHHDHAPFAAKALACGKAVFVEKPLAISRQQLDEVLEAAKRGASLMVGFNRRFAASVRAVRDHFQSNPGPRQVLIRVNAGPIPLEHWIQDPNVGGGRLIGEACHFVDLAVYLCGARVRSANAMGIPQKGRSPVLLDNFSINLTLADGSVATIVYTSIGDSRLPKEYVEVFGGGKIGIIRDFKSVELWPAGKRHRLSWFKQDKGQKG